MAEVEIKNARPADVEPWRMAYSALYAMGLTPGLRVSSAWLWSAMGIPQVPVRRPGETDGAFARRAQSWSLRMFKPQTDALVDHILETHGLYLRSVGTGPNRPGEWELLDGSAAPDIVKRAIRDVGRTLRDASNTVQALSTDGLTAQQAAARDDSFAKLAHLRALMHRGKAP